MFNISNEPVERTKCPVAFKNTVEINIETQICKSIYLMEFWFFDVNYFLRPPMLRPIAQSNASIQKKSQFWHDLRQFCSNCSTNTKWNRMNRFFPNYFSNFLVGRIYNQLYARKRDPSHHGQKCCHMWILIFYKSGRLSWHHY